MIKWVTNLLNRFGKWRYERRFGERVNTALVAGMFNIKDYTPRSACAESRGRPRLSKEAARKEWEAMTGDNHAYPTKLHDLEVERVLNEGGLPPGFVQKTFYDDKGRIIKEVSKPLGDIKQHRFMSRPPKAEGKSDEHSA